MADTDEQRNGVGRRPAEDAVRTLLRWAGDDPEEGGRGGHCRGAFSCRGCGRAHARRALTGASTHGSEAMADTDEQRNGVGRRQAEDAVRTLRRWAGDDPAREGLLDTPKRVVDAYGDWFSGYADDPREYLERTFEEVAGYDEMIVLRDSSEEHTSELQSLM